MAACDIVARLGAALALAACGAAHGQDGAGAWTGVWNGTIGALPVTACLETNQEHWSGSYYYLKHLQIIQLQGGEDKAALGLNELNDVLADAGPAWSLSAPVDGKLGGTWRGNGKTLPIRLSRAPGAGKDALADPCSSEAFSRARETPGKLSTRAAALGKVPYRIIALEMGRHLNSELISLQLDGSSPAIARVNASLHKALLAEQTDVYECGRNAKGRAGEYSSRHEPLLITPRWMVVADHLGYECGGAHPNYGTSYSTWNLVDGIRVDPWRWFAPAAVAPDNGPQEVLSRMLKGAWAQAREPECADALDAGHKYWFLRPAPEGMAFTPSLSHANAACMEEVVVPYGKLLPLMTPAGRDAVASLKADLKR